MHPYSEYLNTNYPPTHSHATSLVRKRVENILPNEAAGGLSEDWNQLTLLGLFSTCVKSSRELLMTRCGEDFGFTYEVAPQQHHLLILHWTLELQQGQKGRFWSDCLESHLEVKAVWDWPGSRLPHRCSLSSTAPLWFVTEKVKEAKVFSPCHPVGLK